MYPYDQYYQLPPNYQMGQAYRSPYAQQTQPQPMSYLSGKVIRDISEVTPQDVPMNGQVSIFPTADGSSIYLKTWDGNGRIQTVRYIPEQQTPSEPVVDPLDDIRQQLDRIEKQLNYRSNKNNQRNNRQSNQENQDD